MGADLWRFSISLLYQQEEGEINSNETAFKVASRPSIAHRVAQARRRASSWSSMNPREYVSACHRALILLELHQLSPRCRACRKAAGNE